VTSAPIDDPAVNVANRLDWAAARAPGQLAVAYPARRGAGGRRRYETRTFAELKADCDRLARGLVEIGMEPGRRIALLVPPSIDFIALVFALLKASVVTVLIDPGMGRGHLIRALDEVSPDGFVAVPPVQAVRALLRHRFAAARHNVTVGRRWFWGGTTLDTLRAVGARSQVVLPPTHADDPAAIIFTTGSTGPPKGVHYSHGNFDTQVEQIQHYYGIQAGEVDLPGFPLFGLFNAAMGVTTVIPDMDPSRPARVRPEKIVEAIHDFQVTQAFGSPAIWDRVGRYCQRHQVRLPSVRRVLSAGAPVPDHVLRRMKAAIHPDGEVHTPYGATEALPVASIAGSEVLASTWNQTEQGCGICVGSRFPAIAWKVIRPVDRPIATVADMEELPRGAIGELIVHGPQVTRRYATRVAWNARSKIADGDTLWHRMGDLGYFDDAGRFWFCGRMNHRVHAVGGPLDTIRCEAVFNRHPEVRRTALVGVGQGPLQTPVLVIEPVRWRPFGRARRRRLVRALGGLGAGGEQTRRIEHFLFRRALPVDIRHNAKIFREKLAVWAQRRLTIAGQTKASRE